jgi:hypothetical protein
MAERQQIEARIGRKVGSQADQHASKAMNTNTITITNILPGSAERSSNPRFAGETAPAAAPAAPLADEPAGLRPPGLEETREARDGPKARHEQHAETAPNVPAPSGDDAASAAPEEEWEQNPPLKRVRARRIQEAEYIIDVAFLSHIIKTLIEHHGITITPADVETILSYFGEADVRTERQTLKTRGKKKKGGCCSDIEPDEVIEVVKKVALNGLSIAKHIPDLLSFLSSVGISF